MGRRYSTTTSSNTLPSGAERSYSLVTSTFPDDIGRYLHRFSSCRFSPSTLTRRADPDSGVFYISAFWACTQWGVIPHDCLELITVLRLPIYRRPERRW